VVAEEDGQSQAYRVLGEDRDEREQRRVAECQQESVGADDVDVVVQAYELGAAADEGSGGVVVQAQLDVPVQRVGVEDQ
jgi:hypothetical protein